VGIALCNPLKVNGAFGEHVVFNFRVEEYAEQETGVKAEDNRTASHLRFLPKFSFEEFYRWSVR
jgi:hypothetical protein